MARRMPELPEEYLAEPGRYFLEWLPMKFGERPELYQRARRIKPTIAQTHLTGDAGGWWYFELGGGALEVKEGRHPKPCFTVTMPVDVWRAMRRGDESGAKALFTGKLKFSGSKLAQIRVAMLFR